MRKTIIFGNGLGMAIDPVHFSLGNALNNVWNSSTLPWEHKSLISRCLPHPQVQCPQGEDELDALHLAISSCDHLSSIHSDRSIHWLSDYGWDFPSVCRSYISAVATHLYDYAGGLPANFANALIDFLKNTNSHVATLNYDKLLYDCFISGDVVSGYDGSLVDGIHNQGFHPDNLTRMYGRNFGYYLHLHGSPLFRERNGVIVKLSRNEISPNMPEPSSHIVLTHIKHKPTVINSSSILSAYWQQFAQALSESSEVIIFGYSGLDNHLNQLLCMYNKVVRYKVIEWSGNGDGQQRSFYWNQLLKTNVELWHYNNITEFTDWDKPINLTSGWSLP